MGTVKGAPFWLQAKMLEHLGGPMTPETYARLTEEAAEEAEYAERVEYRSSKEHADTLKTVERAAKMLRGVPVAAALRAMGFADTDRDLYVMIMLQDALPLSLVREYEDWLERQKERVDEKSPRKEPEATGRDSGVAKGPG